jgi:hypothetical protein
MKPPRWASGHAPREGGADLSSRAAAAQVLKLLRVIRLTKLLRLLRNNLLIENMEIKVAIDYSAVQLGKYLLMLIFLTHWLGCGWCVSLVCVTPRMRRMMRIDPLRPAWRVDAMPPRAAASLSRGCWPSAPLDTPTLC